MRAVSVCLSPHFAARIMLVLSLCARAISQNDGEGKPMPPLSLPVLTKRPTPVIVTASTVYVQTTPTTTPTTTTTSSTTSEATLTISTTVTIASTTTNVDVEMSDLMTTDSYITPRKECRLTNISSPREIHAMSRSYGTWMKDTSIDSKHPDMIWVTMHHRGAILLEYKNLDEMKNRRLSATFALPFQWDGAGHVVYNGSFYYHHLNKDYIIRYDLTTGSIIERARVPSLGYASDDLFQLSSGYTNVDFAVDENGLWIIYPITRPGSVGKLTVSKLDPETLEIITTITTDHNFASTANAFIVCGVLYTTKGPHSRPSRVDFAFDLLREVVLEDISMNIQNRHRKTVMLSYNPRDRVLYGWDKGKLLTYDVNIKEYTDD